MSYNSNFEFIAPGHVAFIDEMRYTGNSQTPVLKVSIAYTHSRKKTNGQDGYDEAPKYLYVTFIGKKAMQAEKNLYIGRGIFARGSVDPVKWKDSNDKDCYGHNFVVSSVQYFGPSKANHEKNKDSSKSNDDRIKQIEESAKANIVKMQDDAEKNADEFASYRISGYEEGIKFALSNL
jgi:single-stranded DNA-binding protein